MESVYAALLLHKAGKAITEAAVEKILKAAGVTPDKTSLSKLITGLKGADINSILASAGGPVMTASTSEATADKKSPKAKKEEEEEEEEPTGIGSLF